MDGELYPTAQQIATRAGVSLRSLFRYSDSLERLCVTALSAWEEQFPALRLVAVDRSAPLTDRASWLASHHTEFWVMTAQYRRAATTLRVRLPEVGTAVDAWPTTTRANIEDHLAPELATFEGDERRLRLSTTEVALLAGTTDHLHGTLGLSQPDLASAVDLLVRGALFDAPRHG